MKQRFAKKDIIDRTQCKLMQSCKFQVYLEAWTTVVLEVTCTKLQKMFCKSAEEKEDWQGQMLKCQVLIWSLNCVARSQATSCASEASHLHMQPEIYRICICEKEWKGIRRSEGRSETDHKFNKIAFINFTSSIECTLSHSIPWQPRLSQPATFWEEATKATWVQTGLLLCLSALESPVTSRH